MSEPELKEPVGVLQTAWSANVNDYAIAGAWANHDKTLLVADTGGGLFGFCGDSGQTLWSQPQTHEGQLLAMAIAPCKTKVATAGEAGRLRIFDAQSGRPLQSIEVAKGWVEHLAWSPEGHWLAASHGRYAYLFDAQGKLAWRSPEHPSTISAIAWSEPHELVTTAYGQVSFFDANTGKPSQALQWKGSLVSLALSPDKDVVACGSQDRTVHFWRRSNGQDSMMSGYPKKPSTLAFDDSGMLLATSGGETVTVWSFELGTPEGTRPGELELHVDTITSLAFAPGTMRLASGSRDSGVVIWALEKSAQEGEPIGAAMMRRAVTGFAWRQDGRSLAALDAQGHVTLWHCAES